MRVQASQCPHCGYKIDGSTCPHDPSAVPEPGDCSLCLSCGKWSLFGDDMCLRLPTEMEQYRINDDPLCGQIQNLWGDVVRFK